MNSYDGADLYRLIFKQKSNDDSPETILKEIIEFLEERMYV